MQALIALSLFLSVQTQAEILAVGFGKIDITPYDFESRPVKEGNPLYKNKDPFYDTGRDRLFDFEEPGALGPDGQPGVAGVDDDNDGNIDNCDRNSCNEYGAQGSDDVRDPNGDNYHKKHNKNGTEGDGKYQWLHLAGFGPYFPILTENRMVAGVHDPVWARTIAIQGQNGVPVILTSTDLPGLVWKHINPVRRRVAKEFNIPKDNIIIASTHNHHGPDAAGYWSTVMRGHNRWYTDRLKEYIYQSIVKAIHSMQPAEMNVATGTHLACIDKNTGALKKDVDCKLNPHPDAKQTGATFDAPITQDDYRDPTIRNTMIVTAHFISAHTGKTLGTFVNYSNHPETLGAKNVLISSDYPHYVREYMESKLGGMSVFFTGTVGNQISALRNLATPQWNKNMEPVLDANGQPVMISEKGFDHIRSIGYQIANEAIDALLANPIYKDGVDVRVETQPVDTKVNNFLHILGTRSVWFTDIESEDRMRWYIGRCFGVFGCVRSDVSVIQIGDLGLVTAPGEVDPAYFLGRPASVARYKSFFGRKVKYRKIEGWYNLMPGKHKAVIGQGQNYLSYLVPRSDNIHWWNFKHPNHYEEFVTTGKNFGDDVDEHLVKMLKAFGTKEPYQARLQRGRSLRKPSGDTYEPTGFNKTLMWFLSKIWDPGKRD